MLVRMPAIDTPERKKNARTVEVKNQAEADALVAQGGVIVKEAPEAPKEETEAPKPKGHK
jgi:hypothetical protein